MDLQNARLQLNKIDEEMKQLFLQRMQIVRQIAAYKKMNHIAIYDSQREAEMKKRLTADLSEDTREDYLQFLAVLLTISKNVQARKNKGSF